MTQQQRDRLKQWAITSAGGILLGLATAFGFSGRGLPGGRIAALEAETAALTTRVTTVEQKLGMLEGLARMSCLTDLAGAERAGLPCYVLLGRAPR